MANTIELVGLSKSYGDTVAVRPTDLDIEEGEFIVLLGPSGCGKSTLLKVIAGLEDATEGELYINGKLANYLRPKDRDVAMVFQNYALYPHMTVEKNIGFPLSTRHLPKREIAERVREVARLVGLSDHLPKYPDQLSGGQRQRVALGRAIIRQPVAFLMDEPLSNLDALLRVQMRSELLKLHKRVGKTTVYVTHDQVEAMTMADRIVVMNNGVVQQIGTTDELYNQPASAFVAMFVGSPPMNLMKGRVAINGSESTFAGPFPLTLPPFAHEANLAGEITVGIRPEKVILRRNEESGAIPGVVDLVELVGADAYITVQVAAGTTVISRVAPTLGLREGDKVFLIIQTGDLHLFDSNGVRVEKHA
jgi:multiple sugar transport system ATP-binding protein